MKLCLVGCNHHKAALDVRQKLAFSEQQVGEALGRWRERFPGSELALLSTCNRVELYAAAPRELPRPAAFATALLEYHGVEPTAMGEHLLEVTEREAAAHLFRVAASLDSMVVGEPQILAQVKQAYRLAREAGTTGPYLDDLFQSAVRTARRVHNETDLHKHRVSIPSVAIADFASRVFERFDDKHVLVLGAGEMADETLRYLTDAGARQIYVVNRDAERGAALAKKWDGQWFPWEARWHQLVAADVVVSTTSATSAVVTGADFARFVAPQRRQRSLFILDLAAPRDFAAEIGDFLGVYLYSLDDLQAACDRNRAARSRELPAAEKIVQSETSRFLATAHHRAAVPVITDLRRGFEGEKTAELSRLFNKLPELDEHQRLEIQQFADRLVNKMLHPPLKSIRDASENGAPHGLLDALRRLFGLEES
jgi:glutamyl-tRNA reductase